MRFYRSKLKITYLLVIIIGGILCSPLQGLANEKLRLADQLFNNNRFGEALRIYNSLRKQSLKSNNLPFAAEMLNNLAATQLMMGNVNKLRELSSRSHVEKWRSSKGDLSKDDNRSRNNLIVNGSFEQGLVPPWGGGQYESGLDTSRQKRGIWWNSNGALAYMKIDTAERAHGQRSLQIRNLSPHGAHVFTTTSQRIDRLRPNSIYRISFSYKAVDFKNSAATIAFDAGWNRRIIIPRGNTTKWKRISRTINIGRNSYVDFRIILETPSTLWIDNIEVESVPLTEGLPIQQVEVLFDQGQWTKAANLAQDLINSPDQSKGTRLIAKHVLARIKKEQGMFDVAQSMLEELSLEGYRFADIELGNINLIGLLSLIAFAFAVASRLYVPFTFISWA